MPNVSIQSVMGLADPLKVYQFQMIITAIPTPVAGAANTTTTSLRCTATALPGSAIDEVGVDLGGLPTIRYAGRRRYSGRWRTVLIEGQDAGIITMVGAWQKYANNPITGVQAGKANYAKQATINLFSDPAQSIYLRTIYSIWPLTCDDIPLQMGASNAVPVNVDWAYDIWDDDALASMGSISG